MEIASLLVFAALLGLIPAILAHRKGHDFIVWWIFGAFLWIIAIVAVFLVKDKRPKCPECREPVQRDAARCPHCQAEIAGRVVTYAAPSP